MADATALLIVVAALSFWLVRRALRNRRGVFAAIVGAGLGILAAIVLATLAEAAANGLGLQTTTPLAFHVFNAVFDGGTIGSALGAVSAVVKRRRRTPDESEPTDGRYGS